MDDESLSDFDARLNDNLYKIWNRMSSGSYMPPPVKAVEIPKAHGGTRLLGVPTVRDRTVQATLKLVLEPILEADFKPCSYGFVRHEAPYDRVGCKGPPSACRSRSLKLRAA